MEGRASRRARRGRAVMFAHVVAVAGVLFGCDSTGRQAAPPPPGSPGTVLSTTPVATTRPLTVDLVALDIEPSLGARVVSLDWTGKRKSEIALVDSTKIRVIRVRRSGALEELWSTDSAGSPTGLGSGDVDGDGIDDLVVGWGRGLASQETKASLVAYRSRGAAQGRRSDVILAPETGRAQFPTVTITELKGRRGVLSSGFQSKYHTVARFSVLGDGDEWETEEIAKVRLGNHWAVLRSSGALVVGRPYGDERETFGDVREWNAGGEHTRVPAVRGIRSLAAVRLGPVKSPREVLCFGAGWHWEYKKQGKGILTCAERNASGRWATQTVDELGSYEVGGIASGDIDADGVVELLARSPAGVFAYTPTFGAAFTDTRWSKRTLGPSAYDFATVDPDGDGGDEIVLLTTNGAQTREKLRVLPRLLRARR